MPETTFTEQSDGRIFPQIKDDSGNQNDENCLLCLNATDTKYKLVVSGIYRPKYLDLLFERISLNKDVYFVQVGAMDGVSFDPINQAVNQYGWRGLLIEPLPDMFEKLKQNYSACQGLIFENAAITEDGKDSQLYRINPDAITSGEIPDWARGISSLYSDRNALGGKDISAEVFSAIKNNTVEQKVVGISFDSLTEKHKIDRIDVLQIDTEGHDFRVLRQVDLANFRPSIIQMEFCNLLDREKFECLELLKTHGYTVYISINKMDILAVHSLFAK